MSRVPALNFDEHTSSAAFGRHQRRHQEMFYRVGFWADVGAVTPAVAFHF